MRNNTTVEFVTALGTLVFAVLVLGFLMPTALTMFLLAALFVLFCLFAVFVIREKAVDEREEQHRSVAGRAAFLTGSALLVLGILIQGFQHAIDPWLVAALIGMILAKLLTRLYSDRWQ